MVIHKDVPLSYWNAQARAVVLEVDQLFPSLSWGTYNGHDPTRARAADGMVPGYKTAAGIALGNRVADHLWANRIRYNIWFVVWRGRIASRTYESQGWRTYYPAKSAIERSPDSAYHRNHPHFSTYPEKPTPYGTVWLDRLAEGVTGSESVEIVQRALGVKVTGNYDAATVSAARVFQRITLGDPQEYSTGYLGRFQTAELLRRTKTWATIRTDSSGDPEAPVLPPATKATYTVQAGDTLSSIAKAYGLDGWQALAALNPGIDPDKLAVGQVLNVPAKPTSPETAPPVAEWPLPTSGEVYLDKLKPGVTGSDSVAYAQTWLQKVEGAPEYRTGNYDDDTQGAVKAYQRDKLGDDEEYVDGILGKLQTISLAGDAGAKVTIFEDSVKGGQVWPEPEPKAHTVRVATWNVKVGNSLANMKAGLDVIAGTGADAVGLQELSDDTKMNGLKAYARANGWACTKRNSAVTTMWRTESTTLVKETYTLVQKSGEPWEDGAGGDDTIYKIIMEVTLRDKPSGREWTLLNHHLVPTVESGGRFRADKPKRVAVFKEQIAEIRKALDQYGTAGRMVAVTGDWNVAWGGEAADWVEKQLDASGATVNWDEWPDEDTHTGGGSRTIDWVAVKNGAPARTRVLPRHNSDHLPVVVDITLKA